MVTSSVVMVTISVVMVTSSVGMVTSSVVIVTSSFVMVTNLVFSGTGGVVVSFSAFYAGGRGINSHIHQS